MTERKMLRVTFFFTATLLINLFDNLALLAINRRTTPGGRGIGYKACVDRNGIPMPRCGEVRDVVRRGGRSIRSARKDAGRKSRLDIRRLQLKAAPAVWG